MFKKGLVTLVCLIVMSAVWSWATATYTVSTEIVSLGTKLVSGKYEPVVGGTVKLRTAAGEETDGTAFEVGTDISHTAGVKSITPIVTRDVEVLIEAATGFKIASVTKSVYQADGTKVTTPVVLASQNLKWKLVTVDGPTDPNRTQAFVVTFAAETLEDVIKRTWQLQAINNNGGGSFTVTRAGVVDSYTTVSKPLIKNYVDTTSVTVKATPKAGYKIDYVVINGVKDQTDRTSFSMTVNGTLRLNTFNFGYKKLSIPVTTHVAPTKDASGNITALNDFERDAITNEVKPKDFGILPVNPVADPYGTVRMIVVPTAEKNEVSAISVTYVTNATRVFPVANIILTDRFGDPVTLPSTGAVKVTIKGLTEAIKVTASYGFDSTATAATQNCTKTCHLDSAVPASVRAVAADWTASRHATQSSSAADCVACHGTMPGPNMNVAATQEGICNECHIPTVTDFQAGHHGVATGHTDKNCQRCHATEGSIVGARVGWTGGYTAVLSQYTSAWRANRPAVSADGITCTACHDHNGLRPINTLDATGTAVVAWDPNGNGKSDDQYDVCTSCHTATDMYHEKSSMDASRIIADSHADNAATGTGTYGNTTVEGYVIRTTSANPCADCHNVHSADLHVQEEWANSAHGGHIAKAKADAVCAPALAWFNTTYEPDASACTDVKSVIVAPSTRTSTGTVSELYGKTAAGIAALKAAGATDATGIGWTHYNWDKTQKADLTPDRGTCQRCHTATGVSNFLNNPATYDATGNGNNFSHLSGWSKTTGSPQQELLYCWGCHSNSQTGALRDPGALTMDYSAAAGDTVVYADVDKSNVCVACHSGNGGTGDSIANATGDFADLAAIQSHYLAAAGVLMTASTNGGTGYEFAGVTYTKDGAHQKIGTGNFSNTGYDGPCVACHMSGAEKHTFEVSAANAVCANCHNGLTDAVVTAAETRYTAALGELDNALKAKGIYFIASYPYFVSDNGCVPNTAGTACESYDAAEVNNGTLSAGEQHRANGLKQWTTQVAGGNGKDTMGAAFNYNLLVHEPGAFAHNKAYAYELITSSLDYLADGKVDGAGVSATVIASSKIDPLSHASTVEAATTVTTCDDCHASTEHSGGLAFHKAQYVSTASQPVTCAACHGTPVSTNANEAIQMQYAQSAHADTDGEAWIHYDWRSANRSACARCHNGTAFVAKLGNENNTSNVFLPGDVLKPGEALACSACHTDAGALRSVNAQFTINLSNGATVAYDVVGASGLCVRCHSGRETGASIKDTTKVLPAPHYAAAAGIVYNTGGYEYSTEGYDSLGTNKTLGDTAQGPCVSCHMSGGSHTFIAAGDAAAKASFQVELDKLKEALEAKNIYYSSAHPYFFKATYNPDRGTDLLVPTNVPVTDWTLGGTKVAKGVMGAAFNYALLMNEPGAYAHNPEYALKLIQDSINFLAP